MLRAYTALDRSKLSNIRATEQVAGQEESLDPVLPNDIEEPLIDPGSTVDVGRRQYSHDSFGLLVSR
jgi:hypothetical protein